MDVVERDPTCEARRVLRDDLGWGVVRPLEEEEPGVARRPSLRPSGSGTSVCGHMGAVEAAAGTRAFEGSFGEWKGLSSRVGGKGLVSGVVVFHLYALISLTWTWLKAFPGESFLTTGAFDRYAVRPRSGARAEGPHLPLPRPCS